MSRGSVEPRLSSFDDDLSKLRDPLATLRINQKEVNAMAAKKKVKKAVKKAVKKVKKAAKKK
jgi:hypothetical protein